MSKWITDREPTSDDAPMNYIIIWEDRWQIPVVVDYGDWHKRHPWMPIDKPEPYVNPKRVRVVKEQRYDDDGFDYAVTFGVGTLARHIPTREAAERIAAIYEETMP